MPAAYEGTDAQSDATVVIKSEKGKGGTWAGATENLKKVGVLNIAEILTMPVIRN